MVAAAATAPVPVTTPPEAWAEVLEPGTHRGDLYTHDDLRDMEANFRLVKRFIDPPLKLGHEDEQPLLGGVKGLNTGRPAVGWVDDLKIEDRADHTGRVRPVLLARPGDVHPHVAAQVRHRAYRKLSPEVYHLPAGVLDRAGVLAELRRRGKDADSAVGEALTWATKERQRQQADRDRQIAAGVSEDVARRVAGEEELADAYLRRKLGKVLRGLALLGEELPVIKTLADLPHDSFSERAWAGRAARRYSEGGGTMDRAEVEAHLKAAGWSDAMLSRLEKLDDQDAMALGMDVLGLMAGTVDPATGQPAGANAAPETAAPEAAAPVEGAAPDAETMIQDLVALGEDEASLRAMDEASLADLWKQKKGAAMSETATQRRTSTVSAADLAAFERRLNLAKAQQASLDADIRRRKAAERSATVAALCERWNREGYVLPRDVDPKSTVPNLYQRLMTADGSAVRRYGERSATEFDSLVAEIEARGPDFARRNFSEKVKDQHHGQHADLDAATNDYIARQRAALKRRTA